MILTVRAYDAFRVSHTQPKMPPSCEHYPVTILCPDTTPFPAEAAIRLDMPS